MEARELAAFYEVARRLSFNQAAAHLGYAQSTISAQIQSLEQDLQVRLFDRLGRSIRLTPAGDALVPFARRLLELRDEARVAVASAVAERGELIGLVSLSAPESLLTYRLPTVFATFRQRHPGVIIDVHPTTIGRFRGETRSALTNGTVELALVLDTPLEMSGFESEIVRRESIDVIAPAGHTLAMKDQTRPADLSGETILYPEAPDSGCVYRAQFERHLADQHVTAAGSLEFASIETVKQCVASGMGVSALLAIAVENDVASGRLARLAWSEKFETYTQMVRNSRISTSPALDAFMAVVRELLSPHTGSDAPQARRHLHEDS